MLRMLKSRKREEGFTLVEILVVIAIVAILAAVVFVVINPVQRINQANDATKKEEVQSILEAANLFSVDNSGVLPTYNTGTALPTVTAATVMTAGAQATQLDGVSPTYLTTIPTGGYRIGQLSNGAVIVGATLSDSSVYTKSN